MPNKVRNSKGQFVTKHGGKSTKLYNRWCAMKERCYNKHNKRYSRYGGRGIRVCDEWLDFSKFREWCLSHGYNENLTIDRKDNNGDYCPENCRFITQAEQNRNYSRNHLITYQGKTLCIADWEKETGINRATILQRIKSGKTLDKVFEKRDMRYKK